ncbi:MAG: AAA family ATPase [Acidimicrobiales bacterium]
MTRERGELLGRDGEIAALVAELDEAVAGRTRLVLVTGEAGIGKSRLLEELAETARLANCLTLTGRAAEFEADLPFAALIDALDPYLRTLDDRDLERLSLDRLGALAAVFPALEGIGPAIDVPVNAGERFRLHRAVGELLERLAARQPVLLVLDDLHWADQASLELAAHLTRRAPEGAILIAFGVRTASMPERASRALASIETAYQVTRLEVPPLGPAALGRLVGVGGAAAGRLHELTRGNPFFALQLSHSGAAPGRELTLDNIPQAVQRAIRLELDALAASAREVAGAAAVVGDPFDLDLTINATEIGEDAVLDGLDELCVHGIVRPTAMPRSFEFRHPLVRSAIYQATPPGTRIARHRLIADHLGGRGAGPVELARHVEHSARHGDLDSVRVLTLAAEAVLAQAPLSAARWTETALSLVPASEPSRRRIRLLGDLALARAGVGDLHGGLDALHTSLSLVEPDDHRALVNVAVAAALGERLVGRPDLADATLAAAYERLDDPESAHAVMVAIARSNNYFYLGAFDEMLVWARRAEAAASRLGDDSLLVAAYAALTEGAAFSGRIEAALEAHALVRPLLVTLDDRALSRQLQLEALCSLAGAELYLDLYHDAYAHAQRGLRLARETGQVHLMPVFIPIAGSAAWVIGDREAAFEIFDDAIDGARMLGNDSTLAWYLFNRALAALVYGDSELADKLSEESWSLAEPLGEGMIRAFSSAIRASVMLETGRPAEAIGLIHAGAGGPDVALVAGGWRGLWYEVLANAHLQLGELDAARQVVGRARSLAAEVRVEIAAMSADRAEAAVAMAAGDSSRAVDLARSAVARAAAIGSPIWTASSQELLGRALAAAGDDEAAATALDLASVGYDGLGAVRLRDRVDGELRRLGRTVRRRTRAGRGEQGLAALTGRELEVAELIRGHATNREIASNLFLSLKTVETHIRHIFEKLGVNSRADVARAIEAATG